jgi:hypothetical protein
VAPKGEASCATVQGRLRSHRKSLLDGRGFQIAKTVHRHFTMAPRAEGTAGRAEGAAANGVDWPALAAQLAAQLAVPRESGGAGDKISFCRIESTFPFFQ